MYNQELDFYIPANRRQIIAYLRKRYPVTKSIFTKMKRKQLTAIYITTRKRLNQ